MTNAYHALGYNLGDRLGTLRAAVCALAARSGVRVDLPHDVSSLYETSPMGGPSHQPLYLNSVLRVRTSLTPPALVAIAQSIEASFGRTRRERWEPRVLDIDLLFVGDLVIDSPTLTLPHPRLHNRRFVLEPLSELAADWIHPLIGAPIGALNQRLRSERGTDMVARIAGPEWVLDSPAG